MKLSDFDYYLPKEFIAQYPLEHRDGSRLMVVDRYSKTIKHRIFKDILDYLEPDDVLVLNKSKVIPARLWGRRSSGGRIEVLLLNMPINGVSDVLVRSRGKLKDREKIIFKDNILEAKLLILDGQFKKIDFSIKDEEKLIDIIYKIGQIPLPPYIKRDPDIKDFKTYQTIYASNAGSVACPTAGLHFTDELLKKTKRLGIKIAEVILHISYATFSPVREEDITRHKMHEEYYEFPLDSANLINDTKKKNGRIICVGTTTCRALETIAGLCQNETIKPNKGLTDLFIYPPYEFKLTDCLITNFHFPKSSLLMLVSAFCDRNFIMKAYQGAIRQKYRFYSYGDCMIIL